LEKTDIAMVTPENDPDIGDRVRHQTFKTLSSNHYTLRNARYEFLRADGVWQEQVRESYDIGDGAGVLPIDRQKGLVILVRQFRWPVFEHGYRDLMTEVIAGKLDGDTPEDCIRKEAIEEAGVHLQNPRRIFQSFMSPGAVKERLHLFVADYDSGRSRTLTSGNEHEGEDISVLETPLEAAMEMVAKGKIVDAKTIMLLQWAAANLMKTESANR
jgi:nudix-type nucleoside diphosphatase (YffH/AdpP family)